MMHERLNGQRFLLSRNSQFLCLFPSMIKRKTLCVVGALGKTKYIYKKYLHFPVFT